jgi:hypothetical protein
MQVAVYARVSSGKQKKEETIESKIRLLKEYVTKEEWQLLPEHVFRDDGISGTRLDRPSMDKLRDVAQVGEIDAVIILSPDRLARVYISPGHIIAMDTRIYQNAKQYFYYRCNGHRPMDCGRKTKCPSPLVRADRLDKVDRSRYKTTEHRRKELIAQCLIEKVVVTEEDVDIYHILPFEEPPRLVNDKNNASKSDLENFYVLRTKHRVTRVVKIVDAQSIPILD